MAFGVALFKHRCTICRGKLDSWMGRLLKSLTSIFMDILSDNGGRYNLSKLKVIMVVKRVFTRPFRVRKRGWNDCYQMQQYYEFFGLIQGWNWLPIFVFMGCQYSSLGTLIGSNFWVLTKPYIFWAGFISLYPLSNTIPSHSLVFK